MNIYENDILKLIFTKGHLSQREMAIFSGYSLGMVNNSLKSLKEKGLLDSDCDLTESALDLFESSVPKRAVILAAGYGMRMVPISSDKPKALLKVKGETLIERQIKQLNDAGIKEIYVVVGYLKEQFEYLIDEYGVELIVNSNYKVKGNLYSLLCAIDKLENSYIIPCDLYCYDNPFDNCELYSWYLMSQEQDANSWVRINRKLEIVKSKDITNRMLGICYLTKEDAILVKNSILTMSLDHNYDNSFFEEALFDGDRMFISSKINNDIKEINTYEDLYHLDGESEDLHSYIIDLVTNKLNVGIGEISNIKELKNGVGNHTLLFRIKDKKYVLRITKVGEDYFRHSNELEVYGLINEKPIYFDEKTYYMLSEYIDNKGHVDANDKGQVSKCIEELRKLHSLKIKSSKEYDLYEAIDFYENLWTESKSYYKDYEVTKKHILELKRYVDCYKNEYVLTHIDPTADNFLILGDDTVKLIDWEYAANQDSDVDIAMFCISSLYDRKQVDWFIDQYYKNECSKETRIKIYCYIATCGLIWSNWCEYKQRQSMEFGYYSLKQYRYAKDYYKYSIELMNKGELYE